MTKLLEEALRRIDRLPADQQDAVAQIVLDELDSEDRWNSKFAASQGILSRLAGEALAEHRRGETHPFSIDEK